VPGTTVFASDLFSLLGRTLEDDELRSTMLACKAEVEGVEGDEIKLEIKDSNRIDLLSTEGIVRTLKGYLGLEKGLPQYRLSPSGIELKVDPQVKAVRPYVVALSARGVKLSEEILISYMNLQEKIHTTYGRDRKRMAIGFYDLDLVKPPITYTVTTPDENAFIPLGFEEEMTPRQILSEHPKGRDYAHLLEGFDRYPILMDSQKQVLSMPPIINSNTLGKVSPDTENLFVEATGSDFGVLSLGLNVLATALADRGGEIGSVELLYEDAPRRTPDFSIRRRRLKPSACNGLLGLNMSDQEILDLLHRARFGAKLTKEGIEAEIPPYRGDVMHETDLIEEVAIMYGYERIDPVEPKIPTIGRTDVLEDFSDALRELMIGLGFQEIMTFVLTSPQNTSQRMRGREIPYVEIENPTTKTFSIFRPDLLPSLLEFLGHNAHVSYPQRVFEAGDAVQVVGRECRTSRRLSFAWADSKVNLTQMKGVVESLLQSIGLRCDMKPDDNPAFIEGRSASILLKGRAIGTMGEIHPEVLEAWQIPVPVLAVELQVEPLHRLTGETTAQAPAGRV